MQFPVCYATAGALVHRRSWGVDSADCVRVQFAGVREEVERFWRALCGVVASMESLRGVYRCIYDDFSALGEPVLGGVYELGAREAYYCTVTRLYRSYDLVYCYERADGLEYFSQKEVGRLFELGEALVGEGDGMGAGVDADGAAVELEGGDEGGAAAAEGV